MNGTPMAKKDLNGRLVAALTELLAVMQADQEKGTQEWCERAERAMEESTQALAEANSINADLSGAIAAVLRKCDSSYMVGTAHPVFARLRTNYERALA